MKGYRPTSRLALRDHTARGAGKNQKRRILDYVSMKGAYGATRDEISLALNIKIQSVTPAVFDLMKSEDRDSHLMLMKSGDHRLTEGGSLGEVLITVKAGETRRLPFQ